MKTNISDGLSIRTVTAMITEVARDKVKKAEQDEKIAINRARLEKRLESLGLKEKREIPSDGNCLFYSLSDQMFQTIDLYAKVRKMCVDWIRDHKDWELPNGSKLQDFAYGLEWDLYCDELAKNGIWGNHLTLIAASEVFGVRIRILSSIDSDQYVTAIDPTVISTKSIVLLSHFAEYHYGSVSKIQN